MLSSSKMLTAEVSNYIFPLPDGNLLTNKLIKVPKTFGKRGTPSQVSVAHVCNPSYLGGYNLEDCGSWSFSTKKGF
jgi:hypothetical protein